jgi:hypothetical protein
MTIEEANNRGWNFAVAAFAASLGVAVAALIPTEDKLLHKVDETLIPIVFLGLLIWYFTGRHKYSRSLIPLGAIALGLVLKLIWLAIEFNDKDDRGDDIGISTFLIVFLVVVTWSYFRPPAATGSATPRT